VASLRASCCAEGAIVSRRAFLRSTLGFSSLVAFSGGVPGVWLRAAAAAQKGGAAGGRVLVVIQLAGGNDGINTVIPFGHDAYYRRRPSICVRPDRVVRLGSQDEVGLHPALAPLGSLFEDGRLAVVQGVGYPNPDRSHFRSMEIWETADPENRFRRTGWLGRALTGLGPGADALQLGSREPALALAAEGRTATSIESLDALAAVSAGAADDPVRAALAEAYGATGGGDTVEVLREAGRRALEADARLRVALDARGGGDAGYPGDAPLAATLRDVAAVIASGFPASIYFVSLGGFDTHARQAPQHERLLSELGRSLAAFLADVAARGHGERVLVLTFSEFGRRLEENRSGGTDHGAAAPLFLASAAPAGPLAGLVGAHPSLDDLDDGDLKHHTDFRRVYATVLSRWLPLDPGPILGGGFAALG